MERIKFTWELYENESSGEVRYCHNCGGKVTFKDSGIRRHNANGKDIYEFAIFKCPKGHTWNKVLGILKPTEKIRKFEEQKANAGPCVEFINISKLNASGSKVIEIYIKDIDCRIRIDKLLARQLQDISRNQIEKMIKTGEINVNNMMVKAGFFLRKDDLITVNLKGPQRNKD